MNKIMKIKTPFGSVELRRAGGTWWYTAEIGALHVDENERNKGHGKELILLCINKAKEIGIVNLVAAIYPDKTYSKKAFIANHFHKITKPTATSLRTGNQVEIWELVL